VDAVDRVAGAFKRGSRAGECFCNGCTFGNRGAGRWSADWGFNVVVVAHLYGAGVRLVVGAAMLRLKPLHQAPA
jgi:hypothetical protein